MTGDPVEADTELDTLTETLSGRLQIIIARTVGDPEDVRDAVQETLERALDAVRNEQVPEGVALSAFVYGIARHVMIDVLRRRKRDKATPSDVDALKCSDPSSLEQIIQAEERDAMRRALAKLPAADRRILRRCFVDGERTVDIAKQLGEPPQRVRKRKSRALERLRVILRETNPRHVSDQNPTSLP